MDEIRNNEVTEEVKVEVPAVVDQQPTELPASPVGLSKGQKAGVITVFVLAGVGVAAGAKKLYDLGKKGFAKLKEKREAKKVVATQPPASTPEPEDADYEDLGPLEESEIEK